MIDNMFSALTYFVVPKTYLKKNIALFLLINDESQGSVSVTPMDVVAQAVPPQGKSSYLFQKVITVFV